MFYVLYSSLYDHFYVQILEKLDISEMLDFNFVGECKYTWQS